MEKKIQPNVFTIICIVMLSVFGASCGDDEGEPNKENSLKGCASLSEQLEAKYAELDEIGYNCSKMKEVFNDILNRLKEGKNCEELAAIAADEGFDSVDEYIAHLSQSFKAYASDCPG